MHMLVLDDSLTARGMIGNMLEDLGFTYSEASNGEEALELMDSSEKPDLVLVDWHMPKMNGIEFIIQMRSQPEYDSVVALMVTTESEINRIDEALEAGANEYLMKPFDLDALTQKLKILGFVKG